MNVIRYNTETLTDKHIKYFVYELMKGVHFMHSKGIIHRDLKPLNVLVTDQWEVKISDFGMSNVRTGKINSTYNLTKGVVTRQYRPPELFLHYGANYSCAVDLWSVGCILAEFYKKDVFIRARSTEEYLKSMLEILGMPLPKIQEDIKRTNYLKYMRDREDRIAHKTWKELLPNAPEEALDLLSKLLTYDPNERLSAREVLEHPYFAEYYDQEKGARESGLIPGSVVDYYDFEFE